MLYSLAGLTVFMNLKASQANFENSKPGHVFLFSYPFKSFTHCEIFTHLSETSTHKRQNSMKQVLKDSNLAEKIFF